MRVCKKCGEKKEDHLFTKQGKSVRNICKRCTSNRVKEYYINSPEKYILYKARSREIQHRRHGITDEEYQCLLNKTDGKCYSCKIEEAKVIDHDHSCCPGPYSCGKCVRGLLCRECNLALGNLKDSIDRTKNLIEYMASW